MKRSTLFISMFILVHCLNAQPAHDWIRLYTHDNLNRQKWLRRVYATADGGFVLCGDDFSRGWVVKTDEEGIVQWSRVYNGINKANWIIDTDDNSFLVAGAINARPSEAIGLKMNADGERQWLRSYGGRLNDSFTAVIELKAGEYVFAGYSSSFGDEAGDGYVVVTDVDGDVIWDEVYGGQGGQAIFALRETEGGIVCAGVDNNNLWWLKIDFDGELLWSRTLDLQLGGSSQEKLVSIVSSPGGFAITGDVYVSEAEQYYWLGKINPDGNLLWQNRYSFIDDSIRTHWAFGLTRTEDNGLVIVGALHKRVPDSRWVAALIKTDDEGNLEWTRLYREPLMMDDVEFRIGSLYSAVFIRESIVAAGQGGWVRGAIDRGIMVKYVPEQSRPTIIDFSPVETELFILQGDSIEFSVAAIDLQQDSLRYRWTYQDSLISTDTSVTIGFRDLGDISIKCTVSDGELADSIAWTVHVRELFISAHQPDTLELTVRRNESVDFSIEVEAVEGEPVNYRWTIEGREVGDEPQMSYQFRESGDYFVWVDAFRDGAADSLQWLVHVRSTVRDFWPDELQLRAPVDTTILFGVEPFDPGEEEMMMIMMMNGDTLAMDTFEVRVGFEEVGEYDIRYIVRIGEEADTIRWEVTIYDPLGVDRQAGTPAPLEFGLLSPSPNPFNSSVALSFALPQPNHIRLVVFDISGRIVEELAGGRYGRGEHGVIWNAGGVPAGIYFARLEAGGRVLARKLVLVR